jgi:RNA polymerase sigma-70 factor (ECF subfamily)
MNSAIDSAFIQHVNDHLDIARKVSRIYFPDADDRDDAIQEMMYQLWRSYPAFDGRSKFSTWMYRVCLNTALTYRRNSKRRQMEKLSSLHENIPDTQQKTNEEEIKLLLDAVATLSPLNKAIMLLYLEDMTYEEIASVTGLTKSNVSVKLVRIKKELEALLKGKN